MIQEQKYLAAGHLLYFVLLATVLLVFPGLNRGPILLSFVIIYDLMILSIAKILENQKILDIWVFSAIFSVFQVFPDWYLSKGLNALVFPDDGLFKIGPVSGYMLGLWTIPLFLIIYISTEILQQHSARFAYTIAATTGLVIFGTSEFISHLAGSWYAQNVTMIGDIALYIIPAEMILSVFSLYMYQQTSGKHIWFKLLGGFCLMIFYLGSAVSSYFLIEDILSI